MEIRFVLVSSMNVELGFVICVVGLIMSSRIALFKGTENKGVFLMGNG